MKKCQKGYRRCSVTKTCVSTKRSRVASNKRCKVGTRKCANRRCYGKSKSAKYQMVINENQLFKR
jgi:hypothetical protein